MSKVERSQCVRKAIVLWISDHVKVLVKLISLSLIHGDQNAVKNRLWGGRDEVSGWELILFNGI